ncbi:TonB-dependent receptor [Hymenobacter sp. GOD-10R]|uniref:SusC/RagA family TonB-linked outer membrane protein n=1 Tax=Hymenobacter sp. GOD-10R TaxID=3093922 RepID=UPI002D79A405|nr:TonB-dependent receptor [Hymenobacter sp. GOD-10R]WRQ31556.1 TonB-dependent receptor [Hymenobacter sp. GOD-10R]
MRNHLLLLTPLVCVATLASAQQTRRIQGTITSADRNEALPGVTVVVQGTTVGTTTDGKGQFNLSVPAGATALRISYVGFVSQDVQLSDKTNFTIKLETDSKTLDDVVVIGYGEIARSEVTGAVSSVNAQQIKDIPVNSAAEALTGRLAGVQVTTSEGTPGADARVRVRGGGSITQDNSPLYVVDGIQVENALSVISPQDIKSVDVLKDAASTAIYGARGANGVVIITTKKGFEGRTTVTYNGFAGFRKITKTLDVLKPGEFIDLQYERASRSSADLASFRSLYGSRNYTGDTLNLARQSPFTDWQKEVFGRDAFQQTHNVTVAGGGKGTTFSLSLTYNREQGIQLQSDYNRKLVNFRFDHKASDKFRFGFNVRANDQNTLGAGTASGGLSSSSRLKNTVQYRPFTNNLGSGVSIDPTQPDEEYYLLSGGSSGLINPIVIAQSEYRRNNSRLANASAFASFNILKNLTLRSTVGIDYLNSRAEAFNNKTTGVARQNGGFPTASLNTGSQVTLNNSNVLTYNIQKGKHTFDALVGHEVYQTQSTSLNASVFYLPLDITPTSVFANLNQAQAPAGFIQPSPTTSDEPNRILSGFTRLNYSFDDKYLITATMRADGSSKFGPGNKVGVFPAASVAWRLSKEPFMQSLTKVSDLKLRLSYGLAGNNRIGSNLYQRSFTTSGVEYAIDGGRTPGLAANSLAYSDLKWESTTSRNVGIDLALFDNRVQFTADAYLNHTYDLLVAQPITPTSGYTSQLRNIGKTSNRGLELQLSGNVIQTPEFSWTATYNMSFNRNRVEDLGGQPYLPGINSGWTSDTGQDYWVAPGQPVGMMYGYVSDGFYTVDDFNATQATNGTWSYVLKEGVPSNNGVVADNIGTSVNGIIQPTPGAIKFKDINGDGVVNTNDRTIIGNANPKFTGGLNQQFTYKGFDASVFLNFVYGNDIYNANKIDFTSAYLPNQNMLGLVRDRWRTVNADGVAVNDPDGLRELNKDAKIWRPTRGRYLLHSWAIEDGSFLRVNNITLGYTLPKALTTRAKIQQLRFYVTLNNLYTFTNYSGFDPEVNTRRGTPLTPGVDYAAYPRSRGYLFGLNLSL